jgi:uncharacterized protein (TIGR02444 family)
MPASDFWQFSLAFYARPGVAPACLRLQDEHGVDVNVMLFVLFAASRACQLDDAALERIEAAVAPWRERVVRPLREVRRTLRGPVASIDTPLTAGLRSEVKRIELEAERLQQLALERLLPREGGDAGDIDRAACARHNLERYLARCAAAGRPDGDLLLQAFTDALQ